MKSTCCHLCGRAFAYEPRYFGERELLKPSECDACLEKRESDDLLRQKLDKWDAMCPPLLRQTDPKRLNQEKLAAVLNWPKGPRGLVLHGETGTGKTRIATLLMKQLFMNGSSIEMFYGLDFGHTCAERFGDYTGEAWIRSLEHRDVILFDDLGKFPFTERVEAELFGLIESRILNMKPNIITTNFVGEAMASNMTNNRGEPLVRRLREFCDGVAFV